MIGAQNRTRARQGIATIRGAGAAKRACRGQRMLGPAAACGNAASIHNILALSPHSVLLP